MSFSESSRNIHLNGSILSAECCTADGEWTESQIDLDTYLGNINGAFEWGQENFSQSADNVQLDGVTLSATLAMEDGESFADSTVNLDEHITNNNGELQFV